MKHKKQIKYTPLPKMNNKISGLRFQPLYLLNHGFVFAYEILSDFIGDDNPEKKVQKMTGRELLSLFILQANIALKRKGIYFINIPVSLLASKKTVEIILSIRHCNKIFIELQDPENLLSMSFLNRTELSRNIAILQLHGWKIWLDDWKGSVDIFSLLPRTVFNGIKLDKSMIKNCDLSIFVEAAHCISQFVVIEGIETNEDLMLAKKSGADLGQGYLWPQRKLIL